MCPWAQPQGEGLVHQGLHQVLPLFVCGVYAIAKPVAQLPCCREQQGGRAPFNVKFFFLLSFLSTPVSTAVHTRHEQIDCWSYLKSGI